MTITRLSIPSMLLAALMASVVACASDEETGEEGYTVSIGPINTPPGEENIKCVVVSAGNAERIGINRIESETSTVSIHHFGFYKVYGMEEQLEPFDCTPFSSRLDPAVSIATWVTQRTQDSLQLPPQVGFEFEPDQKLMLEIHYLNAGDQTVAAEGKLRFYPTVEADFEPASLLFVTNPYVAVPGNSTVETTPAYFTMPEGTRDANFQYNFFTGHTHHLGTGFKLEAADARDATGTMIAQYDEGEWSWEEPEFTVLDQPLQMSGSAGLRYSCSYRNPTSQLVGFGPSAEDEMCAFWTYYWPYEPGDPSACLADPNAVSCCPGDPSTCDALAAAHMNL